MPWWSAVLLGVSAGFFLLLLLLFILVKFVLPRVFKRAVTGFATGLFATKAAVLKGASVDVASVDLVEAPDWSVSEPGEEDLEEEPPRERPPGRWVRVLARVSPAPPEGQGGFTRWEPSELSVIPAPPEGEVPKMEEIMNAILEGQAEMRVAAAAFPEGRVDAEPLAAAVSERLAPCACASCDEDEDEESEEGDLGGKVLGPAEVELVVYVPDEVASIQLHYYSELVGGPIRVPSVATGA